MRTRDRAADLRLELLGRSLRAINTRTSEKMVVSNEVTDGLLEEVQLSVWRGLDRVRQSMKSEGPFGVGAAAALARGIYITGQSALARLFGHEGLTQVDAIHAFFHEAVPFAPDPKSVPPLVDFVSDRREHIPVEVLPLFGAITRIEDDGRACDEIKRVVCGFRCVIRRLRPSVNGTFGVAGTGEQQPRSSLRFFRHVQLAGLRTELARFAELQRDGVLSVDLRYPDDSTVSKNAWPELNLAEAMSRLAVGPSGVPMLDPHTALLCHFSCHLRDKDGDPVLALKGKRGFGELICGLERLRGARAHLGARFGAPAIVFLNTCRSGVPDKAARTSAVDVLTACGPDCLIGTLTDMPDLTAGKFSASFYRALGDGWSVGAALRVARLWLLDDERNPLGIFYTSYFGEDASISSVIERVRAIIPDEGSAA